MQILEPPATSSSSSPERGYPPYGLTERQMRFVNLGEGLGSIAADQARRHDVDNTFPFDTFAALRQAGFLRLTLPESFGGANASPLEVMLAIERLAKGNGSVALGASMHLICVAGLAQSSGTRTPEADRILREVQHDGALINGLASEPDLGSPSRGGGFRTTATRLSGGWEISGRKTWSTLSPALTYGNVLLTVREKDGSESRGAFIVPMASDGVKLEDTWDNLSMRATGSHDVVFDRVFVPDPARLPQPPAPPGVNTNGWGLLTSAVYLGIAQAARDFTVDFARNRVPSGLGKAIAELESVQHKVARIEVLLLQARTVLYSTIEAWERYPEQRSEIAWQFAATKHLVTNHAIEVTDIALRVVGSVGLQRQHPLERYFRDVRAGLGNPPMDDVALTAIGKHALGVT